MILGVFGDIHISKNMRNLQDYWDVTATRSIYYMYDKFDELGVESAICLGDFFDAPRIEAKHMQLVLPILKHINERTYPTYLLLGNHEIDSDDSNILDFLSMYDNIIPVTSLTKIENLLFIPYNEDPTELEYNEDEIVFTHHDIYGSDLAGGKTRAFFGIDPSIFRRAKLVMNGHVHLKSTPAHNIVNAGSLLVSQQGELRVGEYPQYYILDSLTGELSSHNNENSLIYLTVNEKDLDKVLSAGYENNHLVLRVEYSDSLPIPVVPESMIDTLHISYRKLITNIDSKEEKLAVSSKFDLKNYLKSYIEKDILVEESKRSAYISAGMELLK